MQNLDFGLIAKEVLESEALALKNLDCTKINWHDIIQTILNSRGKLIVTGVGKSGLIGAKIAATLASTGTPSFFLHPTEALHGDLGMVGREDIILAISYSGQSDELLAIMPHLKRLSKAIITMSKSQDSALSLQGDFFIPLIIEHEACPLKIAPTTSTTLTLALGDALAVCLMRAREFSKKDFASFHPGGALGKRLFIKIKDLMQTQKLPIITKQTPLKEAIIKMSECRLGNAIITNSDEVICGILSDGDLRRAMMREDFNLNEMAINYATKNPKICNDPEMLAYDALKLIEQNKIQALIIADANNKILGILHLHTLISAGISN